MTAHRERRKPSGATDAGSLPPTDAKAAKSVSLLLVAGFGVLVACLVVLGSIADGVRDNEAFLLDTLATPFLHAFASPGLDATMNGLSTVGSIVVIPVLYVAVTTFLVVTRRFGAALFLTVASGGALLLNGAMKLFFERPRPQLAWSTVLPDYSFPSGHTMNSVAFYGALAIVVWSIAGRRWGIAALVAATVLSILIGISRIYLGYHYLTDVLGGVLAGVSWLLITLAVFRTRPLAGWWRASNGRRPPGATSAAGGRP